MSSAGEVAPYQRRTIRLASGERFACMVDRKTGVPDPWVCRYAITTLRQKSINVANGTIDALCLFHEWTGRRGIDLVQRVGSGAFLSSMEIEGLSEFIRTSKKPGREVAGQIVPRVVQGNTHKTRMKRIYAFVRWRANHVLHGIADPRAEAAVRARLAEIKETIDGLVAGSRQKKREALTDEEFDFLMTVVRPDNPLNPFSKATRHRNFALVLMFAELGVREAEPLVLKTPHANVAGRVPSIRIEPNPNDPEEKRKDPPLVKTNGRILPISPLLASVVDTYILDHRRKVRAPSGIRSSSSRP